MSEHVLKPKEEELAQGDLAKAPDVQFDQLPDELEGAVRAEGADKVAEAVLEVQTQVARPEALLAWIDEARDPEEQQEHEDDNLERSFTVDFIPDTARDGAATENPPADDFIFSANRRAPVEDDDGDGGGGGGGGGEGDDGDASDAPPEDPKKKKPSATPAKDAAKAKSDAKPDAKPKAEPDKGKGKGGKPDGK